VAESPIEQLLGAVDTLDEEAVMALLAPDVRLVAADGRRPKGPKELHDLIADFLALLRRTTHRVTSQWHVDEDTWIAEVDAAYELRNGTLMEALTRAAVLRTGSAGIAELRVYGAHEHGLADDPSSRQGLLVGGRWLPPL
jgi:hypothetical protein